MIPDVEFATSTVVTVDAATVERVRAAAATSPRLRARLCLHRGLHERLHDMLIVLRRGAAIAVHRHHDKAESYLVLAGLMTLVLLDDLGQVTQRIPLGPWGSGRKTIARIAAGIWHTVEVETEEVVLHETTVGPYSPSDTETRTITPQPALHTTNPPRPRHALLVGGSRGIGRVLAERWIAHGKRVSVIARSFPDGWQSPGSPTVFCTDLRSPAALEATMAKIVHNNGPIDDLVFLQRIRRADNEWTDELATTLTASQVTLQALEKVWDDALQPSVVMVGSLAAKRVAREQGPAYHVAKAGLEQLMRYYAAHLGPRGVRFNAVVPGVVCKDTSQAYYVEHPDVKAAVERQIPLGRLTTPEDVCDAIDFLCSPRAASITGQSLVVDGGLSLALLHSAVRGAMPTDNVPEKSDPIAP